MPAALNEKAEVLLPDGIVPFPRGFGFGDAGFRRPRGLRFGPDGRLYCVGEDHVMAFDFRTGSFAGPIVHLVRLNGQALLLLQ
jgi:hypothetical protein